MFHPLEGLTQPEVDGARTREFTGDGTPYLKVPGLSALEACRVGKMPIPLEDAFQVPVEPNHTRHVTLRPPMLLLQTGRDGVPILQRSIRSNDGIWQEGESIFVQGQWSDAVPVPIKAAKS